ncbi:MAG: aminodeoxychorismate synthase, component I, partial [Gemmatimonadetes bacterium]|nr:aminodeoxychorismate synthase, component I [Gemmatimonadota bacterium]
MTGPQVEELAAAPAPVEACARFLDLPYCLLLESAAVSGRLGRYSFLTADPFLVLRAKGRVVEAAGPVGRRRFQGDPFEALRAALTAFATPTIAGLPPFQGGAAGYLGYDLLHHLERVPPPRHDDLALPDLCMGLYDWVLAWDHEAGRAWLVSTGLPATSAPARTGRASARAAAVVERLAGLRRGGPRPATTP